MRVIYLALKDLLQIMRDWKAAFFLIIMPIAFTLLFGFAFGGFGGVEDTDPRLPIGFLNQDDGLLSQHLLAQLERSEVVRLETATEETVELEAKVADAEYAAAVIVPENYSSQMLASEAVSLVVIVDGDDNAGHAAHGEIQAAVMRLNTALKTAEISTQAFEEQVGFNNLSTRETFFQDTLIQAITAWEHPPILVEATKTGEVQQDKRTDEENAFGQASTGMMAQFAIAGLMGAAAILVLERKNRSIQRLITTPITRAEILLGHYLAMFIMIFIQLIILIIFAQLFLRLDYFSKPIATLILVSTTALFAASLGLLIGAVAKDEDQVTVFALIPMFVLAALGGAWVPLEFTPEGFQQIARLTPLAWVIDGFQDIVVRGQGLEAIWLAAVVLIAYALVLFTLAVWRFRYE